MNNSSGSHEKIRLTNEEFKRKKAICCDLMQNFIALPDMETIFNDFEDYNNTYHEKFDMIRETTSKIKNIDVEESEDAISNLEYIVFKVAEAAIEYGVVRGFILGMDVQKIIDSVDNNINDSNVLDSKTPQ